MIFKELENALKFGAANNKKREPLRIRKGIYGMGLVLGILNLGWDFTIRTRSIFEKVEYKTSINTKHIYDEELKLCDIDVNIYPNHDKEGPLKNYKCGTYIRIEKLLKRKHNPEIWRQELGRSFSPEIKFEGVKIIVIDNSYGKNIEFEPCEPEIIDIIPETKVLLDPLNLQIVPDYGDNKEPMQIKGWVALRRKSGSGSGLWGLHTFYNGQLIEAFHHNGPNNNGLLPFNPHLSFSRIHGEIHLDMCTPTFTKLDWNTELESWTTARKALNEVLSVIIKASKEYRVKLD